MSYELKRIGLALVAMLALGAVVAQAASATAVTSQKFTASQYPVTLHSENTAGVEEFGTEGGVVKCNSTYEATVSETSTTLTVTPTYSSCSAFGFAEATVTTNGCDYIFHLTTKVSFGSESGFQAHVDISECNSSTGIQIIAGTCEAWVVPQSGLTTVDVSSMTGVEGSTKGDLTVRPRIGGVIFEVTKDGTACPLSETGKKSEGTYSSSSCITVRGYAHNGSKGAQVDVDVG